MYKVFTLLYNTDQVMQIILIPTREEWQVWLGLRGTHCIIPTQPLEVNIESIHSSSRWGGSAEMMTWSDSLTGFLSIWLAQVLDKTHIFYAYKDVWEIPHKREHSGLFCLPQELQVQFGGELCAWWLLCFILKYDRLGTKWHRSPVDNIVYT